MTPVTIDPGNGPVILAMPHTGTWMPEEIRDRLNDRGRALTDTDWHVDRLYDGLMPDATIVRATFHRYVVDANRDPSGASLYPGQNTTGLVPVTDFDGAPIWGVPPCESEIARRTETFHAPYHAALASEISRVQSLHGIAVLYDCHSIRSHIPFLFEGRLPDFNIGTNDGTTCAPEIEETVVEICGATTGFTSVLNGRFKGGWTTRHYGQPENNIHAIQMELAQSTHLSAEAAPFGYDPTRAQALRNVLAEILTRLGIIARKLGAET